MARGLNKVMLIGNLGNDPDMRSLPSGAQVANISIATTSAWRDKDSGELQERTEWHRVVFFQRLAEIVGQYLHKGSKVYVEGRLQTNKWQDKNGNDRWTTEIIASEMQMLDSRGGSASFDQSPSSPQSQSQPHQQQQAAPAQPAQRSGAAPAPNDDYDDDIPF